MTNRVLRWIAVVPGSLLAAYVARYVVFLGNQITMTITGIDGSIAEAGTGMLMGFAFVFSLGYAGAWIAPSRKTTTALVLIALVALLSASVAAVTVVGLILVLLEDGRFPVIDHPMVLAENLATAPAAIYVLAHAWRGKNILPSTG